MKVDSAQLLTMINMIKAQAATTVIFVPTDEGWTFYSRDPAVISMMSGTLFANAFPEGYEKWDPFAIDLNFLIDVLPKSGIVDITVENGAVTVTDGGNMDKYRLDSFEDVEARMPAMELKTSSILSTDELISKAGDKLLFGKDEFNHIKLTTSEGQVLFTGTADNRVCKRACDAEVTGSSSASYSSVYLKNIFKALPKGETVEMSNDDDYPLRLDMNTEFLSMCIFIAPMIIEE